MRGGGEREEKERRGETESERFGVWTFFRHSQKLKKKKKLKKIWRKKDQFRS